jgi:hypothetical protein
MIGGRPESLLFVGSSLATYRTLNTRYAEVVPPHASIGLEVPQYAQAVVAFAFWQCGQTA